MDGGSTRAEVIACKVVMAAHLSKIAMATKHMLPSA